MNQRDIEALRPVCDHGNHSHFAEICANCDTGRRRKKCLRRLQEFRPDAIVLDVDLLWGGADGVIDVLREDSIRTAIPVMVIGSRQNRAALYQVARFVVSDYQLKPICGYQLVRRMSDLLGCETGTAPVTRIGGEVNGKRI